MCCPAIRIADPMPVGEEAAADAGEVLRVIPGHVDATRIRSSAAAIRRGAPDTSRRVCLGGRQFGRDWTLIPEEPSLVAWNSTGRDRCDVLETGRRKERGAPELSAE